MSVQTISWNKCRVCFQCMVLCILVIALALSLIQYAANCIAKGVVLYADLPHIALQEQPFGIDIKTVKVF